LTEIHRDAHAPTVSEISKKLAAIDAQIVAAALERCELLRRWQAQQPGESLPSLREMQARISLPAGESEFASALLRFVTGLSYQAAVQRQTVAFLGPAYSYSYSAAAKYFGAVDLLTPVNTIGAVFEELERGQSRYGVVPIENSTDGRIVDTLTMFVRSPVRICGEVLLPIHHNLMARCGREQIQEVYSKPQALSQCRQWLTTHLPNARWIEVASTAAAAKIAASTSGAAAVASREAAIFEGLDLIAESIEDNPNNVTRFVVLGDEEAASTGDDKTSLMFQVPHEPGALADVMVLFRDNGLNLTWIESFPVPGKANEYFFFVELEGHQSQPALRMAIDSLRGKALRLNFLGSYPRARA
jgi:chorismate mutase/prephenate dehydratase